MSETIARTSEDQYGNSLGATVARCLPEIERLRSGGEVVYSTGFRGQHPTLGGSKFKELTPAQRAQYQERLAKLGNENQAWLDYYGGNEQPVFDAQRIADESDEAWEQHHEGGTTFCELHNMSYSECMAGESTDDWGTRRYSADIAEWERSFLDSDLVAIDTESPGFVLSAVGLIIGERSENGDVKYFDFDGPKNPRKRKKHKRNGEPNTSRESHGHMIKDKEVSLDSRISTALHGHNNLSKEDIEQLIILQDERIELKAKKNDLLTKISEEKRPIQEVIDAISSEIDNLNRLSKGAVWGEVLANRLTITKLNSELSELYNILLEIKESYNDELNNINDSIKAVQDDIYEILGDRITVGKYHQDYRKIYKVDHGSNGYEVKHAHGWREEWLNTSVPVTDTRRHKGANYIPEDELGTDPYEILPLHEVHYAEQVRDNGQPDQDNKSVNRFTTTSSPFLGADLGPSMDGLEGDLSKVDLTTEEIARMTEAELAAFHEWLISRTKKS